MSTRIPALLVIALITSGYAQRGRTPPDGAAVADFNRRVQAYVALRSELATGVAEPGERERPEDIVKAEQVLAQRVRAARSAAKRGDIFPPAVEQRFRSLLTPELQGTPGRNNRGIIWDEGPSPGAFTPRVNDQYPKDQPLSTVPPTILEALPPLPEGIEYRFVGRHLILRDARANMIMDYIPDAISGGTR